MKSLSKAKKLSWRQFTGSIVGAAEMSRLVAKMDGHHFDVARKSAPRLGGEQTEVGDHYQ